MKRFTIWFALALFLLFLSFQSESLAQDKDVRASLKASVMQRIGVDTDP